MRFPLFASTLSGLMCVAILIGSTSLVNGSLPNFKLQVLHASDLEGGVSAVADAPNFAAVVDALEQHASRLDGGIPSVLLSAGDNYLPGPFFSAAADRDALRAVLKSATQDLFQTPALTAIREGAGRVDIMIMNILGFDASVLGNHEFDLGTSMLREIIGLDSRGADPAAVRWVGAQFPYLSANLDFSDDGNLSDIFTNRIVSNSDFQSTWLEGSKRGAALKIAPATVIELEWTGGVEPIGVVGATTPLLRSISFPGATRVKGRDASGEDMVELAALLQPVIDDVADGPDDIPDTEDDINKIILVSHLQQIAREQRLIALLSGVDIVIAGGSNAMLAADADVLRVANRADGPYPVVTTNGDGETALIVSTPGQYKYVGRLIAEFDAQGRLIHPDKSVESSSGKRLSGVYATDEPGVVRLWGNPDEPFKPGTKADMVRTLTDAVSRVVARKDANVFGRTNVFLEGRRRFVRTEETNLGNLSADANLFAALAAESHNQPITNKSLPLVSIRNGGGIRSAIGAIDKENGRPLPPLYNPVSNKQAGEISQLDIENALRFNNGLTLLTVTARELKWILEYAVAASSPKTNPGRFPQVSGIAFSFDPTRNPMELDAAGSIVQGGSRVRSMVVISHGLCHIVVRSGRLVADPEQPFRVVTLNFMADGGDGYPFPRFGKDRRDLRGPAIMGQATFTADASEQDALAEYLAARSDRSPLQEAETPMHEDRRIQNLAHTSDTVFETGVCRKTGDQVSVSDEV